MKLETFEDYQDELIGLVKEIDLQIPISIDNRVLILMQLNTIEKIKQFFQWVGRNLDSKGNLLSTEIQIMNITARIKHGRELP